MTEARVVVVVDDSPSVRETIAYILRAEGYVVHTAADGAEGLEVIRGVRPRAVLLDAMMPDVDGFEVCRRLRASPETSSTFVVMLTAMGQRLDEERARGAGVDRFMTKPFDDEEVLGLLGRLFE